MKLNDATKVSIYDTLDKFSDSLPGNYVFSSKTMNDADGNEVGVIFTTCCEVDDKNFYLNGSISEDTVFICVTTEDKILESMSKKYSSMEELSELLSDGFDTYQLVSCALHNFDNKNDNSIMNESSSVEDNTEDSELSLEDNDTDELFGDDESEDTEENSEEFDAQELAGKLTKVKEVMDTAGDKLQSLTELSEDNTDQKIEILGLASSAYDLSVDIQDVITELVPEDDTLEESVKRGSRSLKESRTNLSRASSHIGATINLLRRSGKSSKTQSMIEALESMRYDISNM